MYLHFIYVSNYRSHSHYWHIAKNVFFKFSIFKCMHGVECGFSSQHVFVYHYLKKELDKRWKV